MGISRRVRRSLTPLTAVTALFASVLSGSFIGAPAHGHHGGPARCVVPRGYADQLWPSLR
jgi:hypothetical protein